MEVISPVIWKVLGALLVIYLAQKIISSFQQVPNVVPIQPTNSNNTTSSRTTSPPTQPEKPKPHEVTKPAPSQVAVPSEGKKIFEKDAKERERVLNQKKKELIEMARNKMLNKMNQSSEPNNTNNTISNNSTAVDTTIAKTPIATTTTSTTTTVTTGVGELLNPVPLAQQTDNLLASANSLSNSNNFSNTTNNFNNPSNITNNANSLSNSNNNLSNSNKLSASKSKREKKQIEEGLSLKDGEITTVNKAAIVEDDKETKRRKAIEAFQLNKK